MMNISSPRQRNPFFGAGGLTLTACSGILVIREIIYRENSRASRRSADSYVGGRAGQNREKRRLRRGRTGCWTFRRFSRRGFKVILNIVSRP